MYVCVWVEFPWLKRVCQQDLGWITWVQLHVVNPLFLFIPLACMTSSREKQQRAKGSTELSLRLSHIMTPRSSASFTEHKDIV